MQYRRPQLAADRGEKLLEALKAANFRLIMQIPRQAPVPICFPTHGFKNAGSIALYAASLPIQDIWTKAAERISAATILSTEHLKVQPCQCARGRIDAWFMAERPVNFRSQQSTAGDPVAEIGSRSLGFWQMKQSDFPFSAAVLNDTSSNDHYGSRLVMQQFRAGCAQVGIRIEHSVPVGEDWRSPKHIDHLDRAGCVIVNGEGSMHSSRQSALRLASAAEYCRQRSIKCFLINSVYENNSQEIADLVRSYDLIFVRESRSQGALAAQGLSAQVVPDVSLSYSAGASHRAIQRHGILFRTRSIRRLHVSFSNYREGRERESGELACAQSGGMATVQDWAVAGAVKLLRGYAPQSWRKHVKKATKKSGQPFGHGMQPTLDHLLDKVAGSQLVITGRFHLVCLALLTRTPFIAMRSNTHKIEGLVEDIGIPEQYAPEAISLEGVRELSCWRKGELEKVDAYVAHARQSIAAMFNSLTGELI